MKTLVAIILALGLGFAGAYVVVTKQKNAELEKLKSQPQQVVEAAPAPAPVEKVVMMSAPAAPAEESAQDVLNDLLNLKLGSGNERNTGLRMVVFKLETLVVRGKPAVPAIRGFIGRNVDMAYSQQDTSNATTNQADANGGNNRGFNRGNNGGGFGGFGGRGGARRARNLETLQADWVVPPSLRLGLVGTLKEIGGEEAEAALAEMLSTTGRGVEVAYLSVVLEEMAPGKYRDAAVAAAKELLMNPPAIDSPDRLDDLAKSYLYGVLEYFKDTSFAVNAQQMLVGKDGRLDQDAMDYLATVLKDQSVSALYAAYENPGLTNQFDKMRVGREVLNYVGQNSQANALFTQTLNNPEIDSRMKAFTVLQLAGGDFGPVSSAVPSDPQVAASRISLLNSLQSQFANDQALSRVIPAVVEALQNNQPIQQDTMRGLFGGGRRGGNNGGGNQ
jgi:hypothetical protein